MAMLASCAEAGAPFEEDEGNGEEGGGDEAEEAEGPGTGEAFEHCGDGVSDVNSGGAGGAEDAGEGSGRRECGWESCLLCRITSGRKAARLRRTDAMAVRADRVPVGGYASKM